MAKLTHFNQTGEAHMVDVGDKAATRRIAVADGIIRMQADTLRLIENGRHSKGDVLGVARVAGIMAAKKTAGLVPLCHPLNLSSINVDLQIDPDQNYVRCNARVETTGPTGVEMEALVAVQITLLTIYDMCKAVDRGMSIDSVRLLHKSGGKSADWDRE